MPIYEYECGACTERREFIQKFSDAPKLECPACGANELKRLVSAAAFHLKGTGWYVTDFRDKDKKKGDQKDAASDTKDDAKSSGTDGAKSSDKDGAKSSDKDGAKSGSEKSTEKTTKTGTSGTNGNSGKKSSDKKSTG